MSDWKQHLKADATDWLIEKDNPAVRYLTLTNILNKKLTAPEVRRAKSAIMEAGAVPQILAGLKDGTWNAPGRFYTDKYRGTVWQLIILAEHQADGNDPRVKAACEYLLDHSQDLESGGFSVSGRRDGGGRHSEVIPCLTGNMAWSLVKLGHAADKRVRAAIDWICEYQRFDDGEGQPPREWPYDRFEMCWGRHSCHMGVVKSLKALSALPRRLQTPDVTAVVKKGCEYLLAHHVFRRSHGLGRTSKPGWRRLQFPLMYQTDVLEVVNILLDLGVVDGRMQEAIDLIAGKQDESGRWNLESTFNGRFQVNIEAMGKPSKWITYRSMRALKLYYGGKPS